VTSEAIVETMHTKENNNQEGLSQV
jgi:hypothetical protein